MVKHRSPKHIHAYRDGRTLPSWYVATNQPQANSASYPQRDRKWVLAKQR